jgi:hypothetical protein
MSNIFLQRIIITNISFIKLIILDIRNDNKNMFSFSFLFFILHLDDMQVIF